MPSLIIKHLFELKNRWPSAIIFLKRAFYLPKYEIPISIDFSHYIDFRYATEHTKEYYLRECNGCNEFLEAPARKLSKRLQMLLSMLPARNFEKILDIGCGRGELAIFYALNGSEAYGIDYAAEAIRIAEMLKKKYNIKNAFFRKSSASNLPFEKNFFDAEFSTDVVEHLYQEDLEKSVGKSYRTLKPGGLLAIHTMPNAFLAKPLYKLRVFSASGAGR